MIGHEFQPGAADGMRKRFNQQTGTLGPMANEALKILSLRLPNVLSGSPMTGRDMMAPRMGGALPGPRQFETTSPPLMQTPGNSLIDLVTKALMGDGGQAPTPNFVPGITQGEPRAPQGFPGPQMPPSMRPRPQAPAPAAPQQPMFQMPDIPRNPFSDMAGGIGAGTGPGWPF